MTPNTADFRIPLLFRQSRDRRYISCIIYKRDIAVHVAVTERVHFMYKHDIAVHVVVTERVHIIMYKRDIVVYVIVTERVYCKMYI